MDNASLNDKHNTSTKIYLKDYRQPDYWIDRVEMEIDLAADISYVKCKLNVRRNRTVATSSSPLRLNGVGLTLISLMLDGQELLPADYRVDSNVLLILKVPAEFTLITTVSITPSMNTTLEGLYFASDIICCQCEPEGFRRVTYFPDRPDILSKYRVTLRAEKKFFPILLSNGNSLDQGDLGNGQHFAIWDDPSPKPCYLFAVVAGDFGCHQGSYTTQSGRNIDLRIFTMHENINRCSHALHSLQQAMAWDEDKYGREYELDTYMIVAVNDFNSGAMESKGLNIFNSSFILASPETATDEDYYNIQGVIGHEYFHNWSGNRVTCRDWFQLSLKEGFTVYRDQEFSSDLNSCAAKRIADVNILRNIQFAEDSGPIAHPVRPDHYIEINNFYTTTVYNKGAEIVRMIRYLVGNEGFRRGTDWYFQHFDGKAVTTDDFIFAFEQSNNIDLTQFRQWYDLAGTPELQVQEHYDSNMCTYTLNLTQNCPPTPGQLEKKPFHIPIAIGLIDEHGNDIPIQLRGDLGQKGTHDVIELRNRTQKFIFENVVSRPVVSIGRGFSAPVKTKFERSDDDIVFLIANDKDSFNRWDASQTLALRELSHQILAHQTHNKMPAPFKLRDALRSVISCNTVDPMLLSQILTLPNEGYLADQFPIIDVDASHEAVLFTRRYLAKELYDDFLRLYHINNHAGPYEFDGPGMGARAIKNVALGYLMETDSPEAVNLCHQQYLKASNMTDQLASLEAIVHFNVTQRKDMLTDFYKKYNHDSLVLDKWFSVQARSRLPGTLNVVRDLIHHPKFSLRNPNKVRAVIANFCVKNPFNFHRVDGLGYTFLAEIITELNTVNPLIAGRLAKYFSRWQYYDLKRQSRQKEILINLLETKDLSKEVYEIVVRSLEQSLNS